MYAKHPLGCIDCNIGLGQDPLSFVGPVLSIGSFFSRLFGGGGKTYPSRAERASTTMSAVNSILSHFPPELENYIGPKLTALFATGIPRLDLCTVFLVGPKEIATTFAAQNPANFVKARAMAAMQYYQQLASTLAPRALTGEQWMQVYSTVGFSLILQAAQTLANGCSGQAPTTLDLSLPSSNLDMRETLLQLPEVRAMIANLPSGSITPSRTFQPASISQSASTYPLGSFLSNDNLPWIIAAGALVLLLKK